MRTNQSTVSMATSSACVFERRRILDDYPITGHKGSLMGSMAASILAGTVGKYTTSPLETLWIRYKQDANIKSYSEVFRALVKTTSGRSAVVSTFYQSVLHQAPIQSISLVATPVVVLSFLDRRLDSSLQKGVIAGSCSAIAESVSTYSSERRKVLLSQGLKPSKISVLEHYRCVIAVLLRNFALNVPLVVVNYVGREYFVEQFALSEQDKGQQFMVEVGTSLCGSALSHLWGMPLVDLQNRVLSQPDQGIRSHIKSMTQSENVFSLWRGALGRLASKGISFGVAMTVVGLLK